MNLTTYLRLVLKVGKKGAKSPFLIMPYWRGALLSTGTSLPLHWLDPQNVSSMKLSFSPVHSACRFNQPDSLGDILICDPKVRTEMLKFLRAGFWC